MPHLFWAAASACRPAERPGEKQIQIELSQSRAYPLPNVLRKTELQRAFAARDGVAE